MAEYRLLKEALLEIKGLLNQLFTNLCGEDGERWLVELKKFLRRECCWASQKISSLFEFVGTVPIPARAETFVARDNFIAGTNPKTGIRITHDDNFKKYFLDKIEAPSQKVILHCGKLKQTISNSKIIAELGGEEKVETTLAEIDALMKHWIRRKAYLLCIFGYANIFYVRDRAGVLRVVYLTFKGDGWNIHVVSILDSDEWDARDQVFTRNS
jgi:hypothetical protein